MKPYVICHMNSSIDGRILGSRWLIGKRERSLPSRSPSSAVCNSYAATCSPAEFDP
jgi:hypothetical protein